MTWQGQENSTRKGSRVHYEKCTLDFYNNNNLILNVKDSLKASIEKPFKSCGKYSVLRFQEEEVLR